jgi:serine phosphatase RsbU (regulator of sigma subunit)
VNNLLRGEPLSEFNRVDTGIAAFALAILAAAAALALGPTGAVLTFLGMAVVWTATAVLAFSTALAMPLFEPPVAALAALGAMIGYRLVVADRSIVAHVAQIRAHEAEMASAATIQRAMLPSRPPDDFAEGRFDIYPFMRPAKEVGGDLYDIVNLDERRVMISIGDVCGKGIPASLFMAVTQTVMRLVVRFGQDLQAEVDAANKLLVANNPQDMFTTLFCGVLDVTDGTLTYCNCGHNPVLFLRRGESTFEQLRNCGPPLGIADHVSYKPRSITLAPGDEDPQEALFGSERLEAAILAARGQTAHQVVDHVVARVTEFAKGAPQSDDITCVAVVCNAR